MLSSYEHIAAYLRARYGDSEREHPSWSTPCSWR